MDYLDGWDRRLQNFDNSDDYRFELSRVRAWRGAASRFSFTDYAVKILLGSLMRKYFLSKLGREMETILTHALIINTQ